MSMRLSNKEFVLKFPNHPVSIQLVASGEVKVTGKESVGAVSFTKKRKPKRARPSVVPVAKKAAAKNATKRAAKKTAKKAASIPNESALEQLFLLHLRADNLLEGLEQEYQFEPTRKWRMDFAWPKKKVAVEIEGGVWTQGRHTRPQGFINDTEKYNHATMNAWAVLRFTEQCVKNGNAVASVKALLRNRALP